MIPNLKVTRVDVDRIVVSGQGTDVVVKIDGKGLKVIALRYEKERTVEFGDSPCWPTTAIRIQDVQ